MNDFCAYLPQLIYFRPATTSSLLISNWVQMCQFVRKSQFSFVLKITKFSTKLRYWVCKVLNLVRASRQTIHQDNSLNLILMFSSKYDDFEDRGKFVLAKELTLSRQNHLFWPSGGWRWTWSRMQ